MVRRALSFSRWEVRPAPLRSPTIVKHLSQVGRRGAKAVASVVVGLGGFSQDTGALATDDAGLRDPFLDLRHIGDFFHNFG